MGLFSKLKARFDNEVKWPVVQLTPDGFGSDGKFVAWADITAIAAFKRDMFTFDDIWFQFESGADRLMVCEDQPGFTELVAAVVERFPSAANWWDAVVKPAFAENFTYLYRRP